MLNCYCQLSTIFRQYGVSQSECKIDRPRPGLPRVSPRPHTEALGTRLVWSVIKISLTRGRVHAEQPWIAMFLRFTYNSQTEEVGSFSRHALQLIHIIDFPERAVIVRLALVVFTTQLHWAILYYWRTCSASRSEAKNMADLTPFPWQHLLYFHGNCHWPTAILSFRRCP